MAEDVGQAVLAAVGQPDDGQRVLAAGSGRPPVGPTFPIAAGGRRDKLGERSWMIETVRVTPSILPPTIIAQPISEMTRPNPLIIAAITAKRSGSTLATKPVSVVVPGKVATPHDTMGQFVEANRVLDATTSPAIHDLPPGQVALATIYMRFLVITVKDQFGDLIGDVYKDAVVTETIGTSTVSIIRN